MLESELAPQYCRGHFFEFVTFAAMPRRSRASGWGPKAQRPSPTLSSSANSQEPLALAERALRLAEKTFGKESARVALPANNLGLIYQSKHRYGEAEKEFQRAISVGERALGRENPALTPFLDNLVELYILGQRAQVAGH